MKHTTRDNVVWTRNYRLDWLGRLNFWILQWFFIRLQEIVLEPPDRNGTWEHLSWQIIHAVPLTGWWGRYRRLW